jgi:hypothetical protein
MSNVSSIRRLLKPLISVLKSPASDLIYEGTCDLDVFKTLFKLNHRWGAYGPARTTSPPHFQQSHDPSGCEEKVRKQKIIFTMNAI